MVRLLRHRQPKGPATDSSHLTHRATSRLRRSAWRQTRRVPRPAFVRANRKTQENQSRRRNDGGRFFAPGIGQQGRANYEVAPAPLANDWIAAVSSSWISNTPYSLVVFSRSRTWTDGFSSLISAA